MDPMLRCDPYPWILTLTNSPDEPCAFLMNPALSFISLPPPPRTHHRTHRIHRLKVIPASPSSLLLRRLVEWDAFSEKMGSEGYPASPRSAWEQSSRAFERLSTLLREMQVRNNCSTAQKRTRGGIDTAGLGDVRGQC
jgi:hypothetical protein